MVYVWHVLRRGALRDVLHPGDLELWCGGIVILLARWLVCHVGTPRITVGQ